VKWIKSSYSSGQGACVELATLPDGGGAVRDSKDQGDGAVHPTALPGRQETPLIKTLDDHQDAAALAVDELDLDPVTFKLMQPEPGVTGMTLADADRLVGLYRCYLKLCVWYPEVPIVPSKPIDEVWHNHILDTAAYARDCQEVFGYFLHHFPYLGLRGDEDVRLWHGAFARTCDLFREHFGINLTAEAAGSCDTPDPNACQSHGGGGMCCQGECDTSASGSVGRERPRPDRTLITA
jgi:hypothetical protein